uniref:ABC transporter ATP-binding protein n=1 Tax=Ignisphaera aggregans TaxID=334771 RepID=A0A7C5YX74_9CREN
MSTSTNLLELREVTKIFSSGFLISRKRIIAVDEVSFALPGDKPIVFTLAGESGSGKTTIARIVLGFLHPDKGEVLYFGRNIFSFKKSELKNYYREVQAVFQDPYSVYNPIYTVDHVLYTTIKKYNIAQDDYEARELIDKALTSVGLRADEVLGKYPYQLSGGQRQRLLFARCLLLRPKLIVADEPVSMLDASLRAGILNLILDLKDKYGISFLYITHDLSTANYISDYLAIIYRGSIVEMGPIDKILQDPLHPYTKLLIDSIPKPDPNKRWRTKVALPPREFVAEEIIGCKFYDRCPYRMDICYRKKPSIKQIDSRIVYCHLYK